MAHSSCNVRGMCRFYGFMHFMSSYFHVSSEFHVWALQLGVVAFATLCCNLAVLRLFGFLSRAGQHARSPWRAALLQSARLPVGLLVWLLGVLVAAALMRAVLPEQFFVYLREVRGISLIMIAALFAMRLIGNMEAQLLSPQNGSRPVDLTTARAIGKLLRLVVCVIAALMLLQTLGVSVSGVLAFGGVGAMAVGFAAKDMLANFFGGLMVYWDRPFSVGDHIRLSANNIDGVVEDIGWRTTCVRNYEKRPLYIPNALFTNSVVENFSRMSHRHINETVGLRYDDAPKMAAICDDVRQMLHAHPDIASDQKIVVSFDAYSASSLDFMVYCFTAATEFGRFHAVKQDVMLKVMDIVARHGAEFAFPTQTLYLNREDASASAAPVAASPASACGAASATAT